MQSKCQYQLWFHLKDLSRPANFLAHKSNLSGATGMRDPGQQLNRHNLEAESKIAAQINLFCLYIACLKGIF